MIHEIATATQSPARLIPEAEFDLFARLGPEDRAETLAWVEAFDDLIENNKPVVTTLQRIALQFDVSEGCAKTKFYRYRDEGWQALVHKSRLDPRKYAQNAKALSEEDIELWKSYCERNHRKCKPAHRQMLREWRAGKIKTKTPVDPYTDLPRGWTYENLIRHRPSDLEQAASRRGSAAAKAAGPLIFTTRENLDVGQFYLFDDMEHDHRVHVPGQNRARVPLEFHCVDLFSGYKAAWGIKPTVLDLETNRRKMLTEQEMRLLVAYVLGHIGFHPNGCTLVVEHGTAAIRKRFAKELYNLSGGRIKVRTSGIDNGQAFAGQYAGASKGNFRFKAALESLGNLIHNEMAHLPGQKGSIERLNGPEDTAGRLREHSALANAIATLPPDLAQQLRLPVLDIDTFRLVAGHIYARINARTDHRLQGYRKAGLTITEFRLPSSQGVSPCPNTKMPQAFTPWHPLNKILTLPEPNQRAISAALHDSPSLLTRARLMSPAEVWESRRSRLVRLSAAQIAQWLAVDDSLIKTRESTGRYIHVQEGDVNEGEPMRFLAATMDGEHTWERHGQKVRTLFNPYDPERLHVFNADGRWLGACARVQEIAREDTGALAKAAAEQQRAMEALLYPVARRGAEVTLRRIEDAKHNAAVLKEARDRQARQHTGPTTASERNAQQDAANTFTDLHEDEAETQRQDTTVPIDEIAEMMGD